MTGSMLAAIESNWEQTGRNWDQLEPCWDRLGSSWHQIILGVTGSMLQGTGLSSCCHPWCLRLHPAPLAVPALAGGPVHIPHNQGLGTPGLGSDSATSRYCREWRTGGDTEIWGAGAGGDSESLGIQGAQLVKERGDLKSWGSWEGGSGVQSQGKRGAGTGRNGMGCPGNPVPRKGAPQCEERRDWGLANAGVGVQGSHGQRKGWSWGLGQAGWLGKGCVGARYGGAGEGVSVLGKGIKGHLSFQEWGFRGVSGSRGGQGLGEVEGSSRGSWCLGKGSPGFPKKGG